MNRRNFFAFLPIAPVALISEGAKAEEKLDISAGAPIPGATRITFSGNKKKDFKPSPTSIGGLNMNEADYSKEVSLAVGDDGYLWLRRKDCEWKRIVTE